MGSLNDYTILKPIGKGSYGEVHLIQHKKEKKQYVVKKMALQKASRKERKSAELEAKLLSKLKHPNIVSYKDSFESDEGFLYIVMGYAEGGDLYTRLRQQRERNDYLSEVQVVRWFIQICMALQYLHQKNILHRDLKTQNIFLTKTKMIKVGDLGIARVLDGASDMATTLIGTPYYMSPELFSNRPYNHKSDVWALGCCVYEMTTLKHAFNAKDMNSLVYKILKKKMPKMPEIYSGELCDLIKNMLHQNADKRPSVNRILRNPFIKKHIQLFLDESSKSRRPTSGRSRLSTADSSSRRTSTSSVQSRASSRGSCTPVFESDPPPSRVPEVQVSKPRERKEIVSGRSRSKPSAAIARKEDPGIYVNAKVEVHRDPIYDEVPPEDDHPYESIADKESTYVNMEPNSGLSDRADRLRVNEKPEVESAKQTRDDMAIASGKSSINGSEVEQDQVRARSAGSTTAPNNQESKQVATRYQRPLPPTRKNPSPSPRSVGTREETRPSREKSMPTESSRVSSARERRRREKQKKASEMKEAVVGLTPPSVEIPYVKSESERLTPPGGERRKESTGGEEVNQFYTLLHTTLKLEADENSPPQTPPEPPAGTDSPPLSVNHPHQGKLSPVKEVSESASSTITETDSPPEVPSSNSNYARNTPQATEIVVHTPPILEKPPTRPITQATLASTGRLMNRIVALRKECIRGLGVPLLHRAYELLDESFDEDELEVHLIKLLGEARFRLWAGKIWQLKFCEESIFKHCGSITAY